MGEKKGGGGEKEGGGGGEGGGACTYNITIPTHTQIVLFTHATCNDCALATPARQLINR